MSGGCLFNAIFFPPLALDVEPEGVRAVSGSPNEPFRSLLEAQERLTSTDGTKAYGRTGGGLTVEELAGQACSEDDSRASLMDGTAATWDSWSEADLLLATLSDAGLE